MKKFIGQKNYHVLIATSAFLCFGWAASPTDDSTPVGQATVAAASAVPATSIKEEDDLSVLSKPLPSPIDMTADFAGNYAAIKRLLGKNQIAAKALDKVIEPLYSATASVLEYRLALTGLGSIITTTDFAHVAGVGNFFSRTFSPSLLVKHLRAMKNALKKSVDVIAKIRATSMIEQRWHRTAAKTNYQRAKVINKRAWAAWQLWPLVFIAAVVGVLGTLFIINLLRTRGDSAIGTMLREMWRATGVSGNSTRGQAGSAGDTSFRVVNYGGGRY